MAYSGPVEGCVWVRIFRIGGTAHQAVTARFGADLPTSVLDIDCKDHELDNLYVADGSSFPPIRAVDPTLKDHRHCVSCRGSDHKERLK